MQSDWIGYVILFLVFCVAPTLLIAVVGGIIWWMRRNARASKPTVRPLPAKTPAPRKGTPPAKAVGAAPSRAASPAPARVAAPARVVVAGPTLNVTGSASESTPLYLNFSNKPRAIIENIQALNTQAKKVNTTRARWSRGPKLLSWAGLFLILIEGLIFLLGYTPSCAFVTGGIVLWVIAIYLSVKLKRAQVNGFPASLNEFEEIIHSLRDDVRPGTGFVGNLDLTGARQASKVAREANDARGRTTQYFRDQWLNFKAKMYDGNVVRVSGIQRVKERKGYWGTGKISGKSKWKPAKSKGTYQELKVRIAVNPEMYSIARNAEMKNAETVGEYTINAVDTSGGLVTVLASSPKDNVSAESVLGVMKFAYGLLKLKKA